MRGPATRTSRTLCAAGVAALAAGAVALAAGDPGADGAVSGAEIVAVGGSLQRSTDEGAVVLRVPELDAGETSSGTLRVTNVSGADGRLWLAPGRLAETPAPGGGRLSERLQLTVADVTHPDLPVITFSGAVDGIGRRPLGFVAAGRSRMYSVAATFIPSDVPDGQPGEDDAYTGASARVGLEWDMRPGAASPRTPRPEREPKPSPPSKPRPTPSREPEPEPEDTAAPRLHIGLPARQPILTSGALAVESRCSEPCRVAVTGRVDTGPSELRLGSRAASAPAEARTLRILLTDAARESIEAALVDGRAVTVRLAVTATDRAGNRVRDARRITLNPGAG